MGIIQYLKKEYKQFQEDKRTRTPKWFFYAIGEDNYRPTLREWTKRGIMNGTIFLMSIVLILAVSISVLDTLLFRVLNIFALLSENKEILWLAYGILLGIGVSLIFGVVANPEKSVYSRFITSMTYVLYYCAFFIVLNILVYVSFILT